MIPTEILKRVGRKAKRMLRSLKGGPPPEVILAGRLLEGLGLHLALNLAENAKDL